MNPGRRGEENEGGSLDEEDSSKEEQICHPDDKNSNKGEKPTKLDVSQSTTDTGEPKKILPNY